MPSSHFPRGYRVFCLITLVLLCVFGAASVRMRSVSAQNGLKLTVTPSPRLAEAGKITVAHSTDAAFKFKPDKFTFEEQPTGVVNITRPTEAESAFLVEPVKSGSTTLTISYKDEGINLSGTVDLVVPYKSVRLLGDAEKGVLTLVSGQKTTLDAVAIGRNDQEDDAGEIVFTSKTPEVIEVRPEGGVPTVIAKPVARTAQGLIGVTVDGVEFPDISVQVTEAIDRIEVVSDGVIVTELPIVEGETKDLTVRLIGVKGTVYKPSEFPDLSPKPGPRPGGTTLPIFTLRQAPNDIYKLTANNLTVGSQQEQTIEFRLPGRGVSAAGAPKDVVGEITAIVTQRVGSIRLTPSAPTLTQNSRVTIRAEVLNPSGLPRIPMPDVSFTLRPEDALWATIVEEGNQATVVWRNPNVTEIREANNNQLVPRPSEVVVTASASLEGQSQPVTSTLSLSMGEVIGFDFLKVKLNIMDQRTASDLYGKVTSDEYYVLTVRLFNNLKDPSRQEFTGNSILAYSSSIEVAVGLEKKFNAGTDSYFPSVLSKGAAGRIARRSAQQAETMADSRIQAEITAAERAQAELTEAIDDQYESRKAAINAVNNAVELRTRAEQLTLLARKTRLAQPKKAELEAAIRAANDAIKLSNDAMVNAMAVLERARVAEEKVETLRRAAARAAISQMYLSRDISNFLDPDTAINDGKWHPVSGRDLNRLYPPNIPEATPASTQTGTGLDLLSPITEASLEAMPAGTSSAPASGPDFNTTGEDVVESNDPPCVGVVTYRPYTFEMMVNTVDRRDGRSRRSKVFKVLDSLGTGASFVTAVAVPGSSSDLPLGLEKYRNLLIPGIEKLWPSPKEQQRQNIVSQAMKEIEEIPFGSDITRVIFIPKKVLHGVLRGHDVRISEICPYFFRIQVAIVSKSGTAQTGTIVR